MSESSPGFARERRELTCDGVSLGGIAREFGTPCYVYSAASIVDAYRRYDRAFAAVPHRICYALKANANGAIARLLASLGAGADIVSGGELRAARRAGFAPDHIVFAGVGKTDEEIALGLDAGVAELNVESEAEIARVSALAQARTRRARIALRVNPDIDPGTHPYISTGLRQSKFGVAIAAAPDIVRRTRELPGIAVVGVHCHIGSQIQDVAAMAAAVRAIADLATTLRSEGFPIEVLDIGGGLGVDYERGEAVEPATLAAAVLPHVLDRGFRLLLEPGRSIVGPAGVLLTRVVYVKDGPDKRFVIADAGMNDLLRPSLYDAFHRIEPVTARGVATRVVDVVGPVCETGDFFARDRMLEEVEPGDLLAIRDVGAYGFVMASNYNMRGRAAEVMVEDRRARLVRRRETFEDLVRTEIAG